MLSHENPNSMLALIDEWQAENLSSDYATQRTYEFLAPSKTR